jgi:hypothetical protein
MDFGSRGSPRIRITMRIVEEKANMAATSNLKMASLYHTAAISPSFQGACNLHNR